MEKLEEKFSTFIHTQNPNFRIPKTPFKRIKYLEAQEKYGSDFETILSKQETEPFFLIDIPIEEREFYDRLSDDGRTLVDMDLIYPYGFGEGMSGGEREYELDRVLMRMRQKGTNPDDWTWYLDEVKKGIPRSAGCGIGIERFVRFVLNLPSVKDARLFANFLEKFHYNFKKFCIISFIRQEEAQMKDVIKEVEEKRIDVIWLQFVDILGFPKLVEISPKMLRRALDEGVAFDGSSIEGFARIEESDMLLKPNPETFTVLPWTLNNDIKIGKMICDVYVNNNTPFEGDPRFRLRKIVKEAEEKGFIMQNGAEEEFFLFKLKDNKPSTEIVSNGSYFEMLPEDVGEKHDPLLQKS